MGVSRDAVSDSEEILTTNYSSAFKYKWCYPANTPNLIQCPAADEGKCPGVKIWASAVPEMSNLFVVFCCFLNLTMI